MEKFSGAPWRIFAVQNGEPESVGAGWLRPFPAENMLEHIEQNHRAVFSLSDKSHPRKAQRECCSLQRPRS